MTTTLTDKEREAVHRAHVHLSPAALFAVVEDILAAHCDAVTEERDALAEQVDEYEDRLSAAIKLHDAVSALRDEAAALRMAGFPLVGRAWVIDKLTAALDGRGEGSESNLAGIWRARAVAAEKREAQLLAALATAESDALRKAADEVPWDQFEHGARDVSGWLCERAFHIEIKADDSAQPEVADRVFHPEA